MVRILNPYIFLLTPLLLLLILLMKYRYIHTKKLLLRIYTKDFLKKKSFYKIIHAKMILLSLMYIFILIGFSKIQIAQEKDINISYKNIIFLIDISRSMYVVDKDSQRSRISKVINYLDSIVEKEPKNKYMVLGFSDKLLEILPLTDNAEIVKQTLQGMGRYILTTGTTDYNKVIEDTKHFLERKKSIYNLENTHVLFVSDGESHTNSTTALFYDLNKQVDSVQPIFVGGESGGVIKINNKILMDNKGTPVLSIPNFARMKDIADYLRVNLINLEEDIQDISLLSYDTFKKEEQDISWIARMISALLMFGYIITLLI